MPNSISSFQGHDSEILALDFNKYNNTIVSGGVDSLVKVWDLRNFGNVAIHRGHRLAVRSLKCSPHSENVIASTSYDMTCRVWNTNIVHEAHSEFVTGVDFSLFVPGQIATCAWDESIHIFNI
jgi:peroxin-7